jgi:hypothetical protein
MNWCRERPSDVDNAEEKQRAAAMAEGRYGVNCDFDSGWMCLIH